MLNSMLKGFGKVVFNNRSIMYSVMIIGKQLWKQEFACDMYDNALIDRRLDDIRRARASGDIHNLMFMLRAGNKTCVLFWGLIIVILRTL